MFKTMMLTDYVTNEEHQALSTLLFDLLTPKMIAGLSVVDERLFKAGFSVPMRRVYINQNRRLGN